jgi:hypothetical protein
LTHLESKLPLENIPAGPAKERLERFLDSVGSYGNELIIKEGILYNRQEKDHGSVVDRLVIPVENDWLKIELLKMFHNIMGHPGEANTLKLLLNRVHWGTIVKDVKDWIKSCTTCAKAKPTPQAEEVKQMILSQGVSGGGEVKDNNEILEDQLKEFPTPFSQIVVDFTEMSSENTIFPYALVIIDRATRWAEVYPVKNLTATEYLKCLLKDWIPRFGVPASILADNGKAFIANITLETYRFHNIKAVFSLAHSPQSHGIVERVNRTLKEIFRCINEEEILDLEHKPISWVQLLPYALMFYRGRVNSSLGYSRAMLVYGREMTLPIDTLINNDDLFSSATDYVAKHVEKMRIMNNIVKDKMEVKQKENNLNNANNSKIVEYKVGTRVYIRELLRKNKLCALWKGPYEIINIINPVTFEVKSLIEGSKGRTSLINYRRLKKVVNQGYLADRIIEIEKEMNAIVQHSDNPT